MIQYSRPTKSHVINVPVCILLTNTAIQQFGRMNLATMLQLLKNVNVLIIYQLFLSLENMKISVLH